MNVERIFFWIRLVTEVILGILDRLQEPGNGLESLEAPGNGFKPERIQVWLGVVTRAVLRTLDEAGVPPAAELGVESAEAAREGGVAARGPTPFKPERIQFWLKLVVRFLLSIFEETGKSGEPSAAQKAEW